MGKISFLCEKEITDMLKRTIEKSYHKCQLHIVKIEEHAEYKDMAKYTVEYGDPSYLMDLGRDILISRLRIRGQI